MTKLKPGRPKSASPRQNVRIRLPQSAVEGIDTLCGGAEYANRTAVIEAAVLAFIQATDLNRQLVEALEMVRDYVVTMKGMGHDYQITIDSAIAKARRVK